MKMSKFEGKFLVVLMALMVFVVGYMVNYEMGQSTTVAVAFAAAPASENQESLDVQMTSPAEAEPEIEVTEPVVEESTIPSYEEFMAGIYDKKVYAWYEKLFSVYDYEQFMTRSEIPQYFQSVYHNTRFAGGTIKSSGCGISCLAMITSYLYDTTITPDMLTMDYHGNNPAWVLEMWTTKDYLGEIMDMNYGNDAVTAFDEAMAAGCPVILLHRSNGNVQSLFTDGGHFIVVAGMTEDGRYIVNDPNMYNLCCLEDMNCRHVRNGELCPLVDEYMNGFTRDQLVGPNSGLVGTYVFPAKGEFNGDPAKLPHK